MCVTVCSVEFASFTDWFPINQSINQSISQSINQSINLYLFVLTFIHSFILTFILHPCSKELRSQGSNEICIT